MAELTRYVLCDNSTMGVSIYGEWVQHDDVEPLLAELDKLRAENAALRTMMSDDVKELSDLRTRVLEWVTVTDDPATLPRYWADVILQLKGHDAKRSGHRLAAHNDRGFWALDRMSQELKGVSIREITPGDRWAYIPETPRD